MHVLVLLDIHLHVTFIRATEAKKQLLFEPPQLADMFMLLFSNPKEHF